MDTIKIVIEIRGGVLTAVYANASVEYVLVDFDNLYEDEEVILNATQPDIVKPELNTIYGVNKKGEKIAAELKRLNF